jgi:hypothetical protein
MAKTEVEKNPAVAAAPRRITAETRKAETKLIALERDRVHLMVKHADETVALREKRLAFVSSLPADVVKMLVAGEVLTQEEVDDARSAYA